MNTKITIPKEYKNWHGKTVMATSGRENSLLIMTLEAHKIIMDSLETNFSQKEGLTQFIKNSYTKCEITDSGEFEMPEQYNEHLGDGDTYYFWPWNGNILINRSNRDLSAYYKEFYANN